MFARGTMPPTGVNESCMLFTAPHEVPVVTVAKRDELTMPNRTSLPSMLPPGLSDDATTSTPSLAWIGLPRASARYEVVTPAKNRMYIAAQIAHPWR